jgi:alkanesulfonate monooxygenase SsuD/methylene tetrahydromethanopterin reductase-like flavin-dependent oxidoreductase (luciferase family)
VPTKRTTGELETRPGTTRLSDIARALEANPKAVLFETVGRDDDRIGRDVGCAAARFYYGDNDAELNHVRFGSSEGVARIKARMAGYSNDDLLETGMAIGGNADSVCRQVERWAATGIDQMILMFQIGRTKHDQIMR